MKKDEGMAASELLSLLQKWDSQYYFQSIEADKSNFELISMYGHYEDWQPIHIVYPEKESRFLKKGSK